MAPFYFSNKLFSTKISRFFFFSNRHVKWPFSFFFYWPPTAERSVSQSIDSSVCRESAGFDFRRCQAVRVGGGGRTGADISNKLKISPPHDTGHYQQPLGIETSSGRHLTSPLNGFTFNSFERKKTSCQVARLRNSSVGWNQSAGSDRWTKQQAAPPCGRWRVRSGWVNKRSCWLELHTRQEICIKSSNVSFISVKKKNKNKSLGQPNWPLDGAGHWDVCQLVNHATHFPNRDATDSKSTPAHGSAKIADAAAWLAACVNYTTPRTQRTHKSSRPSRQVADWHEN